MHESTARNLAIKNLLIRNPEAFSEKITKTIAVNQINSDISQFSTHKKGCNCKKSGCKKKYCECYGAGVKCTSICKCEECKNNKACGSHDRKGRQGIKQVEEVLSKTKVKKLKLNDNEDDEEKPTQKKNSISDMRIELNRKLSCSSSLSFEDFSPEILKNEKNISSTVKTLFLVKTENKVGSDKGELLEI
jgi:hypothetical protein